MKPPETKLIQIAFSIQAFVDAGFHLHRLQGFPFGRLPVSP